jgi:hypothetical protein
MQVYQSLEKISRALEQNDISNFKNYAHALKGSSSFVGAARIHYDCYYIQYYHQRGEFESMKRLYNRLVEDILDFHNHCFEFVKSRPEDHHIIRNIQINNQYSNYEHKKRLK